ncbi:MAG: hypothetical protein K6G56_08735 [Clostridiales bacterium]|nr:hypothetical protein [Clostridiales bacterium]
MSAARLFAGVVVIAACALFGSVRNAEALRRLKTAEGLRSDISEAEHLLTGGRKDLFAICETLSFRGACADLWRDISNEMQNGSGFYTAFSKARKPDCGREAAAELERLAALLGKGDAAAESERLRDAAKRLGAIVENMQKNRAEKCRLTSSLSLLLGLCLALLLI